MTSLVGFPLQTVYQIIDISRANPGVVSLASVDNMNSFAVAAGQTVTISRVQGMHEVNNMRCIVGNLDLDAMTFSMYDIHYRPIDTSQFSPYLGAGEINIISYVPPPGQPAGLMYNNQ